MIDKAFIGRELAPSTLTLERGRLRFFAQAIGETDPVHWDLEAARAAGRPACPVPPTFLKAVEGEHFSSAALLQLLQVPLAGVLHAEQQFDHLAPVHVGDVVEVSRRVDRIFDRKDGALTFIVVDTEYRVDGRMAARSTQTILSRRPPAP